MVRVPVSPGHRAEVDALRACGIEIGSLVADVDRVGRLYFRGLQDLAQVRTLAEDRHATGVPAHRRCGLPQHRTDVVLRVGAHDGDGDTRSCELLQHLVDAGE